MGPRIGRANSTSVSRLRQVRRWLAHRLIRLLMATYFAALFMGNYLGRRRRTTQGGKRILLTGTFFSDNWIAAHLGPLAASRHCSQVWMVSNSPVPAMANVIGIYPPRWLIKLVGQVPARLMTFAWTALRKRPDIVGGFHLLVNGLLASLLARYVAAQSLYFSVGGPMELLDGGIWAENRLFGKMETPDPVVEQKLIRVVGTFDLVITMGTGAIAFFRNQGIETRFHVVSGGIDAERFQPADSPPTSDLILVGRLAEIKRVDIFLQAVRYVADKIPTVTASIVGDGELREPLEQLARDLGIEQQVQFMGHQPNVIDLLRQARIFVLTSDTEGLSLALMEAMMCGLPAIVSNVGDLGDLVKDGINGFLVERRSPHDFADRIVRLLSNDELLRTFSQSARRSAMQHEVSAVSRRWDDILQPQAREE